MGVTYSLECLKCGIVAPEVGDFGHIGAPTLATTAKRNALRPFGLIYAACAAVGLLSEELESTKAFLEAHRGHRVKLLGDGEAEGDEDDFDLDEDEGSGGGRTFRWKKGKFVDAFHVIECVKCGESLRSLGSVQVRPFPKKTLTATDKKRFLAGAEDIDQHVYRAGPPLGSLDDLLVFVAKHKAHSLTVALDEGERAKKVAVAPRSKALVSPAAVWIEADDERRLSAPRDESLWEALRGLRHMDVDVRRRSIARLRESRDQRLFGHVASMLLDPDVEVRVTAAATLGALDDPRRLAPLGRALLDHDVKVRDSAREALAGARLDPKAARAAAVAPSPEPPSGPELTGSIEVDLFSAIVKTRSAAVDTLASKVDEKSLMWISKSLADPDFSVRWSAAKALGTLLKKTPSAVPWLLLALDDYSQGVATAALKAASTPTGDALVGRIDALVLEGRVHETECIDALEAIGTEQAQRAIARLMDHPMASVAEWAAYRLTKMKRVHVLPELIAALSHSNARVAAHASTALAKLPLDVVLGRLIEAFRHKPDLRHSILCSLESRHAKVLHRLFLAGLRDRSKPVRMRAAMWLVRREDDKSKAALIAAARRGDGAVAAAAFEFLLAAGEAGTEAGLEKAFPDALDSDLMAASFIHSGNKRLAAAARRRSDWLPKRFPKIKWGSGRAK